MSADLGAARPAHHVILGDLPSKHPQPSFCEATILDIHMPSSKSIHQIHGSVGRLIFDGPSSQDRQTDDTKTVSVPRRELDPMGFPPRMRSAVASYGGVVCQVQGNGPEGSNGAREE